MADYWITTHWPVPATVPEFSRHVYVKERNVTLPTPGDVVFIRESIDAKDKDGRRVTKVNQHHRGKIVRDIPIAPGYGGIIGMATVEGTLRKQLPEDVVFDFGDLSEWSVIPCRDFQAARLPLDKLRDLLRTDNVRGLNLWLMPDDAASKLLKALGH